MLVLPSPEVIAKAADVDLALLRVPTVAMAADQQFAYARQVWCLGKRVSRSWSPVVWAGRCPGFGSHGWKAGDEFASRLTPTRFGSGR